MNIYLSYTPFAENILILGVLLLLQRLVHQKKLVADPCLGISMRVWYVYSNDLYFFHRFVMPFFWLFSTYHGLHCVVFYMIYRYPEMLSGDSRILFSILMIPIVLSLIYPCLMPSISTDVFIHVYTFYQ